jgi:hypothetical protein
MSAVTTICPSCGAQSHTEYRLLGAPTSCSGCARDIVPQVPNGGSIPVHTWDLTFHDFKQLIEDPACRSEVAPLISAWFGYRLAGENRDTLILNDQDEAINPLWLHLKIQGTSAHQFALYQQAMSLWR